MVCAIVGFLFAAQAGDVTLMVLAFTATWLIGLPLIPWRRPKSDAGTVTRNPDED